MRKCDEGLWEEAADKSLGRRFVFKRRGHTYLKCDTLLYECVCLHPVKPGKLQDLIGTPVYMHVSKSASTEMSPKRTIKIHVRSR